MAFPFQDFRNRTFKIFLRALRPSLTLFLSSRPRSSSALRPAPLFSPSALMKLTYDVIKVLLKALAMLLIGMTVLAAGAAFWGKTKKAQERAGASLVELRETLEERQQDFEDAKAKRDAALEHDEEIQLLRAKVEATATHIETLRQEATSLSQNAEGVLTRAQARSEDFSRDLRTWQGTNDDRNTLFKEGVCAKASTWKADKCEDILTHAKVTPSSGDNLQKLDSNAWLERVNRSVGSACDGMADKVGDWFDRNLLRSGAAKAAWQATTGWRACHQDQQQVEFALRSMGELLRHHEEYQRWITQGEAKKEEANEHRDQEAADRRALNQLRDELLVANIAYDHAKEAMNDAQLTLNAALSDPRRFVEDALTNYWVWVKPFFWTVVLLLLSMILWRPAIYFTIARVAGKLRRVTLLPTVPAPTILRSEYAEAETETTGVTPTSHLRVMADQRKQLVQLTRGEKLWVRPDYVVSSRGGGAQWIYGGWRHPFTSYAAGLVGMTVFDGDKRAQRRGIAIAGTGEAFANAYITRLDLKNHSGFVVRPSHVVAIQGDVRIRARWSFRLVSLLRGQVRFMVAEGTGSLYFVGYGGAFPHTPGSVAAARSAREDDRESLWTDAPDADAWQDDEDALHQLHDGLVIGWDARLAYGLERNENWIDVALLRRSPMFESSFVGEGIYLTTNAVQSKERDVAGRFLEAILNTIGKVLGI